MNNDTALMTIVLRRLEDLIDQETSALRAMRPIDLRDFSHRKGMALVDLSRAARSFHGGGSDSQLVEHLARVKQKLEANHELLGAHLGAAAEMTRMIIAAIKEQESDGTYGRGGVRAG